MKTAQSCIKSHTVGSFEPIPLTFPFFQCCGHGRNMLVAWLVLRPCVWCTPTSEYQLWLLKLHTGRGSPGVSRSPSWQLVLLFQWHSPSSPKHTVWLVLVSRGLYLRSLCTDSDSHMRCRTGRPCRAENRRPCRMNPG